MKDSLLQKRFGNEAFLLDTFLNEITQGVAFITREKEILYWNKAAERMTGFTMADVVDNHCEPERFDYVDKSGKHLCDKKCQLITAIAEQKVFEGRVYMRTTFEKRIPVDIRIVPVSLDNKVIGGVEIFSDATIAEVLESEMSIEPLTRFPLWHKLETSFDYEDERIQRYGFPFCTTVVMVNKYTTGGETLDECLKIRVLDSLGDHVRRHVRKADLLCRYDSDNFVVLMPHTQKIGALQLAERLRDSVEQSSPSVTISIGLAERKKNETIYETIRRASTVLQQPGESENNRIRVAE